MNDDATGTVTFSDLDLEPAVLEAVEAVGYETPTPIQAKMIPHMLAGRDVVGQAQTGTGKTAAFALPALCRIDPELQAPQVLVMTPTRELAIQVAEAFQRYGSKLPGFHVVPIYGGQAYGGQFNHLRRGPQVVVGTPGRVIDHIKRGTLNLDAVNCVVLDEGDEMLRMGFIEDIQWILEQAPSERQTALFSATMPDAIRRIAQRHLSDPVEVTIEVRQIAAQTIRQRYWMTSGYHKLDALTRILEAETFDGMLIFVHTRQATAELAEKLEARGYASAPLSGDIAQALRERTVDRLKDGKLDIIVATDVAARGLDVDRISHVINFDIPNDPEAYIHRIGRTGRAGRRGEAILFVSPRERRLLHAIERATGQRIELLEMPTTQMINDTRVARFKERIKEVLSTEDLGFFYQLVEEFRQEENVPAIEVAAALARLVQGDEPLLLPNEPERPERPPRQPRERQEAPGPVGPMRRYSLAVGHRNGVRAGNIVGAITNEAGLTGDDIGKIQIFQSHTLVDLPASLSEEAWLRLKAARLGGRELNIMPHEDRKLSGGPKPSAGGARKPRQAAGGKGPRPRGRFHG